MKKTTACRNCTNRAMVGDPEIWYNNLCIAVPGAKYFDCISGQDQFMQHEYAYCREVNRDGNCVYYIDRFVK